MKRIISLFFFSILFYSCDTLLKVFQEEDLLERPPAKRCADCHKNIYEQWTNSRHSLSWMSESYKKATENYRKTKCFSCHIPYEIKIEEKPKWREKHKEDGINCVSCHFREKTKSMHGPYHVFSPPHPSTEDKNYKTSKICSGCHQETYKQWIASKSNKQCQECHMPAKKGSLIQKFPFEYLHFPKDIHNHAFPTGIAKDNDFILNVEKNTKSIKVHIKNTGIPHNLPTADNGKPKLYLTVIFYKDNKEVYKDFEMFFPKKALPFNKDYVVEFLSPAHFNGIKIILERKLSWKKKREKILEKKF